MTDRPTLQDIARRTGVHASTVSRALNPGTASMVKSQTRSRVLEAARALGYRPHPLARGLRTNRTMTVGMVIPDIENPLFGPIIAGAEAVLAESGYSVLIGNPGYGTFQAESVVAAMLDRQVDGLLVAAVSRRDDSIAAAAERGVPAALVNRTLDDESVPAVVGDDHLGIGLAVRHLAELGHRRIGHVAGPSWLSTGHGRREAFWEWMEAGGLAAEPDQVEEADWFQVEPGYRACLALLGRRPDLTAVVAGNDLLGLGCYRAIRATGRRPGRDISVTGYNDMPLLEMMQPAMTAVRVPYREMGGRAGSVLLSLMSGQPPPAAAVRLKPTLEIRASTAPAPS